MIAGPMFSGKSEELIRLLRRAAIARQRVQVFKPKLDNRYSEGDVVSHTQMRIPCELVERADEIMPRLDPRTEVVGIDEAQFFDDALPRVCGHLANLGKRVIVAGLDMDYRGIPFGGGRRGAQDPRHLHELWLTGRLHPAIDRVGRAGGGWCDRLLRSAMPTLP
jgi:thymidine kinase